MSVRDCGATPARSTWRETLCLVAMSSASSFVFRVRVALEPEAVVVPAVRSPPLTETLSPFSRPVTVTLSPSSARSSALMDCVESFSEALSSSTSSPSSPSLGDGAGLGSTFFGVFAFSSFFSSEPLSSAALSSASAFSLAAFSLAALSAAFFSASAFSFSAFSFAAFSAASFSAAAFSSAFFSASAFSFSAFSASAFLAFASAESDDCVDGDSAAATGLATRPVNARATAGARTIFFIGVPSLSVEGCDAGTHTRF